MAVIAGASTDQGPYPRRVVIQFKPEVQLPYTPQAVELLKERAGGDWQQLQATFPGIIFGPYFTTLTQQEFELAGPEFRQYYVITCSATVDAAKLSQTVSGWRGVETSYVEARPGRPPVHATDDPRNEAQHYQDAAPVGIDARYAWQFADGSGVALVDVEQGWTLDHEDLAAAGISLISGCNDRYHGHGTAVLGITVAGDNCKGGVGIAPGAGARVVSEWRCCGNFNTAEAILSARAAVKAGDVLLIESQTELDDGTNLPVEIQTAVFHAILSATGHGITVVEAAGNKEPLASGDLDQTTNDAGKFVFKRADSDFRDSGAILVAAATANQPYSDLMTNFGSRVDCFARGDFIDTCSADGWVDVSTTGYLSRFGGTSGAAAIVAGAALLLQSWRVKTGRSVYSPHELRTLLSHPCLNTKADPLSKKIGVMPNLRAIIDSEA